MYVCLHIGCNAERETFRQRNDAMERGEAVYHRHHRSTMSVTTTTTTTTIKTPKIWAGISESHTPPTKKKPLPLLHPQRKTAILPQTSARLIFFCIFVIDIIFYNRKYLCMRLFKKPIHHSGEEVHRMGMYRGMEINLGNRTEMGLSRMARQNSMMKRQQRVNEFADGYRLGEMLEMGMEGMED